MPGLLGLSHSPPVGSGSDGFSLLHPNTVVVSTASRSYGLLWSADRCARLIDRPESASARYGYAATVGGIPRNENALKPISVALRDGPPTFLGHSALIRTDAGFVIETVRGSVYVGVVPGERMLDAVACFRVLDRAKHMNSYPIIWNHLQRLPADSACLATLMMGRAIECCAPILLSDDSGIHELVELANRVRIPTRRVIESSGDVTVDLGYAWGMDNAFRMVTRHVPARMRETVLDRYRSLA